MENNAGPMEIGMRPQRRRAFGEMQSSPTTSVSENNATPTTLQASHTESPSPYPETTQSPYVNADNIFRDIKNPLASYQSSGDESLLLDQSSSLGTVDIAGPITTATHTTEAAASGTNEPTRAPESHGRSSSPPTVAIVIPIVVVALLVPLLIIWYLGCRRRTKSKRISSYLLNPPETAILEKRMQENLARAREEWTPDSLFEHKTAKDYGSPSRFPMKRVQRPRSAQQLRTSDPPHGHFSGFNFDFPRRATTFAKRNSQRPLPDPSNRHSSIISWEPGSPYPSRAAAFTPSNHEDATALAHPTTPRFKPPDDPMSSGSEASLGLLAREGVEASTGRQDISPALSLHEEISPYDHSGQPLSDAISEISGLSVDHDLWPGAARAARHLKSRSEVSALEPSPRPRISPN